MMTVMASVVQHVFAAVVGFGHLAKDMEKNSDEWFNWCNNESREHTNMPGDWARMSEFKQLLLLRALRPDRVAAALQRFCESIMGARYVNQEAFSAQAVLAESSRWVVACGFGLQWCHTSSSSDTCLIDRY
jgi:dynein heavy chain